MNLFAKLDKLNPREKAGMALAVAAVMAVIGDRLVVSPLLAHCRRTELEIAGGKRSLVYYESVLKRQADVFEAFKQVRGLLGLASDSSVDLDVMKGEIDDLARQAGLTLLSMKHREPRGTAAYAEYVVEIGGFEGNMRSLLTFLYSVQCSKAAGMLRVVGLNVTPGRAANLIKGSMLVTKVMMKPEEGTPGS